MLTIAFIYKDEKFSDPSVSFAFIPNTTALRVSPVLLLITCYFSDVRFLLDHFLSEHRQLLSESLASP